MGESRLSGEVGIDRRAGADAGAAARPGARRASPSERHLRAVFAPGSAAARLFSDYLVSLRASLADATADEAPALTRATLGRRCPHVGERPRLERRAACGLPYRMPLYREPSRRRRPGRRQDLQAPALLAGDALPPVQRAGRRARVHTPTPAGGMLQGDRLAQVPAPPHLRYCARFRLHFAQPFQPSVPRPFRHDAARGARCPVWSPLPDWPRRRQPEAPASRRSSRCGCGRRPWPRGHADVPRLPVRRWRQLSETARQFRIRQVDNVTMRARIATASQLT